MKRRELPCSASVVIGTGGAAASRAGLWPLTRRGLRQLTKSVRRGAEAADKVSDDSVV